MFRLYLFGSPVLMKDGEQINIRRKRGKALLAYLALQERPTSRETLATLFWAEYDQSTAYTNLRRELNRLKKDVGEGLITADRQNIAIDPEAKLWVDVSVFETKIQSDEISELAEALDLYTDDFMTGFTLPDATEFDEWQYYQTEALRDAQVLGLQRFIATKEATGEIDEAIGAARRWLLLDNLHEAAHRALMRLYALAGQLSTAIRQFQICVETLEAEMGLEPTPATIELYEKIKAGQYDTVEIEPLSRTPLHLSSKLPASTTPFIGRDSELETLFGFMDDPSIRLVTILGPGGMGKTRLALALAEKELAAGQFEHGVFFIDLSSLTEPQQIVSAVVEALGIQIGGGQGSSSQKQLLAYLSDKEMMFIMDNFEHLLAGAELILEMIKAAPMVQIVVTTRERLQLQQEQLFPIPGLEFPEWQEGMIVDVGEVFGTYTAVELFLGAARRVRPDFELASEDMSHLTRICHLVGGMPLALELAAGWVELLPLSEIVSEIERSLGFLETVLVSVPDRQRSIRVIFDTTWERLDPSAQAMMQRLAVFRGGFSREAARQVAASEIGTADYLRLLNRLVSMSLLQVNRSRERYQIHELLRQYARERLERSGELALVQQAHASYFLAQLKERETDLKGSSQQKEALDEIELDFPNIRAAWFQAIADDNLELIDQALESFFWYFWLHTRHFDGITLLKSTMEQIGETEFGDADYLRERIKARYLYFDVALSLLDPEVKFQECQLLLEHMKARGNQFDIALAHLVMGYALIDYNWPAAPDIEAIAYNFHESLIRFRELGEDYYVSQVLDWLSAVLFTDGQTEERVRMAKERLEMAERMGDRLTIADVQAQIGLNSELMGQFDDAIENYQQALPVFKEFGDKWHYMEYLLRMAGIAFLRGDNATAKDLAEEAQIAVERFNLISVEPHVIEHLSIILCAEEAYEEALELSSLPVINFYPPCVFGIFRGLIFSNLGLGNMDAATEYLRKTLERMRKLETETWQTQCMVAAAIVAEANAEAAGQFERAVEMLALASRYPVDMTGWMEKFPMIVDLRRRLAEELGAGSFKAAWERGEGMDLGTAVSQLRADLSV